MRILKAKATSRKAEAKSEKAQTVSKKAGAVSFSREALEKDIVKEGKVLGLPSKAVKVYAGRVAEKVGNWVEKRGGVTESDINRQVAKEIEKYNKDISFVYKNRGKII